MAQILSVGLSNPPYEVTQDTTRSFVKRLFSEHHADIERLLSIVQNGEIDRRYVSAPLAWFDKEHTFEEKNKLFIEMATHHGIKAIDACLNAKHFIRESIGYQEIDAIFFITSTGIATPTIDAKIMNHCAFSQHTKRIPIWGIGCAGGVSGVSRAYEYCRAYPAANVLVLCIELCSLTFQKNDYSKSNLIGASLFADGAACVLVSGERSKLVEREKSTQNSTNKAHPRILDTMSTFMPDSEDVMGWDVRNNGLYVIFSKDIPTIIRSWLSPNVEKFLNRHSLKSDDIQHFVAHPGGKKVIEAYYEALSLPSDKTLPSRTILRNYGNMSSPTVIFVLESIMNSSAKEDDLGLMLALGPGFSSELILLEWT
ncbi:chalcone synthase [Desulfuribacillus stibiiarsenatis]|uniref:Chalcone synthase n=1 Tax=Desulfuribacillus stibiiarsenatis TaxID=1390249 RepID=A0A1E5L5X4_9FIRM|nr:chalcone synthase [Desulfuribacillus stibiiarsenatis]